VANELAGWVQLIPVNGVPDGVWLLTNGREAVLPDGTVIPWPLPGEAAEAYEDRLMNTSPTLFPPCACGDHRNPTTCPDRDADCPDETPRQLKNAVDLLTLAQGALFCTVYKDRLCADCEKHESCQSTVAVAYRAICTFLAVYGPLKGARHDP